MALNIDQLNISDVSQYNFSNFTGFILYFNIDGFRYSLYAKELEDGMIYPNTIYHLDKGGKCKYCKEVSYECQELIGKRVELFHRLIEFPSIRLNWLYIDYV